MLHNRAERHKYYHHREKARSEPLRYATVIIDGMDQSKTNLPHLTQNTKSTQNLWKLRTHLTGALLHTQSPKGKLGFGYYDLLQWPHDCNLTIHPRRSGRERRKPPLRGGRPFQGLRPLLHVLVYLADHLNSIPEVLYIQLDNCYRENKNRYMFGFCSLLVQLRIVKKVSYNITLLA